MSAVDVRDALNLTPADIPDSKVTKMIKRAEVTLELEMAIEIDYDNCTDAEKEFMTILAAIYIICHLTGGSAVGLNYSIGDENVSVVCNVPPLSILQSEVGRILYRFLPPPCLTRVPRIR